MARAVPLLVMAVVIFFPTYMTFISAIFPPGEIVRSGPFPPLSRLTWENFELAINTIPFGQQYITSVAVVFLQTVGQFVLAALAAYALVFPRWRLQNLAFVLILATMAVPGDALTVPNYELVSGIGLRDTILGIVIPFIVVGYPVFLLRQAFAAVPRELWEASRLDGCSDLRSLFLIIIPTARNQALTAVMWSALAAWNGFFWPLLITDSAANRTVQVGLAQLARAENGSPAVTFAGTALVLIPTILLVILGNKFLVEGMARGSIK
ncbi:MAG: carbohydrate ABC transporter permease [Arachnia sp.]